MGRPKAELAWEDGTLLSHVVSVLAAATGGPVAVVRAAGQALPALPALSSEVLIATDPRPGLGPVQGIAAGLAALAAAAQGLETERLETAFVAATDMPYLHAAFVRRVLEIQRASGADVALPIARGHAQPLAAAYRISLAPVIDGLLAAGKLRPADLFALPSVLVTRPDAARLLDCGEPGGTELAAADPGLQSLVNVNEPAEYEIAVNKGKR
jgi:molybdopterin-guanine dinucleotide biosynthesis protein A